MPTSQALLFSNRHHVRKAIIRNDAVSSPCRVSFVATADAAPQENWQIRLFIVSPPAPATARPIRR